MGTVPKKLKPIYTHGFFKSQLRYYLINSEITQIKFKKWIKFWPTKKGTSGLKKEKIQDKLKGLQDLAFNTGVVAGERTCPLEWIM